MTILGYQIPNFSYPEMTPAQVFGSVVAQATEATNLGSIRFW